MNRPAHFSTNPVKCVIVASESAYFSQIVNVELSSADVPLVVERARLCRRARDHLLLQLVERVELTILDVALDEPADCLAIVSLRSLSDVCSILVPMRAREMHSVARLRG